MSDDKSPEPSRPSYFDKLSDTLDNKMLDFNLKMLGVLGAILFKPAAVATEPFFRKNMGERYFTYTNAVVAGMIWWGVGVLNKLFAGTWRFESESTVGHAEAVGGFIDVVFLILAAANISAARQRQKKGIRWHSMGRGESLFGSESPIRDWIITVLVAVVLYKLHAGIFAAFFLLSRVFSEYLEQQRQQALYNRYLDIMDAQIESEYLQQTLAKGPAPMLTDGIYHPLPGHFKGEHREKVARVVAGTFTAPDVAGGPAKSATESKAAEMPDVLGEWSKEAKKWGGQIWSILLALYKIIGKKRLLYLAGAILLVVVIRHWGVPLVKSIHFHRSPPPVVAPAQETKPAKQVETKPVVAPERAPAVAPASQEKVAAADLPDIHPVGSTSSQSAPPVVDTKATIAPTATQYAPPATVSDSGLDKLAEAVKSLNIFSNYCYATLAADNSLIEKIADQKARDRAERVSQAVEQSIGKIIDRQEQYLDQLTPGPDADASIERSMSKLIANRASETNNLEQLNVFIQQAMSKN